MSGAVAIAIMRARKDIVRHFIHAGATTPETAVTYDPDDDGWPRKRMRRRQFRLMCDFGAVQETGAGRFYLDEPRLEAFRAHMRRRALSIVAVASAAVAVIAALA